MGAQTARVKLMTALGKDNLSVQADIDGTDLSAIEVEYERDLEDGRTLTASLTPADKNLEVEVTDTADNLKEVGASRSVTIGDRDVTVSPSFLVKAQTARVKLMTALGKDNLSVQA